MYLVEHVIQIELALDIFAEPVLESEFDFIHILQNSVEIHFSKSRRPTGLGWKSRQTMFIQYLKKSSTVKIVAQGLKNPKRMAFSNIALSLANEEILLDLFQVMHSRFLEMIEIAITACGAAGSPVATQTNKTDYLSCLLQPSVGSRPGGTHARQLGDSKLVTVVFIWASTSQDRGRPGPNQVTFWDPLLKF